MRITGSRIILDRVKIHARHGVDPQESLTGAYFYVTMEADTDFGEALHTDELSGTVSYATLYELIRQEMAVPSRLLEHVAGRILQRVFRECPTVARIRLKLTKENPPMRADCREAGIDIEAER